MKIIKNSEAEKYILELVDTNYLNMSISDMFSSVVGDSSLFNKEKIATIKKKFGGNDTDIVASLCFDYWELDDENEEDNEVFEMFIAPSFTQSNIQKYLDNPYYKKVKIKDFKYKDYELKMDHYEPYELFALLDMKSDSSYHEVNSISFFDQRFDFLSLNHKGKTWMSVTPNEIETMEKSIELAKGRVLVLGLGIGYYPFMVSLKENVKEIVIVEKDSTIIELFNKYLFPQFDHKGKIKIVNDDAFNYLSKANEFDCVFSDLWHDPFDGIELFLKIKQSEKEGTSYMYWLESSFYLLLRRCFISLLEEQLNGAKESEYKNSKNFTDKIINTYYQKTKNLVLTKRSEVQDLISDKSLLDLLIK